MSDIKALLSNEAIWIPALAWFIAQLLKVLTSSVKHRKFMFTRITGSGGMPSSHSAYVVSLATVLAIHKGFDSYEFALATALSFIVMTDAAGVRRAAGRQAALLNRLIHYTDFKWETSDGKPHLNTVLKELLGHTPLEVFAGALLGILVALVALS